MEEINIASWFPRKPQWVEVGQRSRATEAYGTPTIKIGALGGSAELSGIGVNKRYTDSESYKISMDGSPVVFENLPTSLHWLVLRCAQTIRGVH